MAQQGGGYLVGVARDDFATLAPAQVRDLLPATVSAAAQPAQNATAEIIEYPNGSRMRGVPVGGAKKRAFDLIATITILIMAAPLLIAVALFTKLQSNGPVFFGHKRIGFRGRVFLCWKFRTMVVDADKKLAEHLAANPAAAAEWARDQKLRNDPRITPVGRLLRKTSLDELPQLWNVIRGDMSLVGPRPVVADELVRYGKRTHAYLSARPGLTGLWQVSGRNSTTYDRRTYLDAAYVRNWRLVRDLKIIFRTIPEMLMSSRAF